MGTHAIRKQSWQKAVTITEVDMPTWLSEVIGKIVHWAQETITCGKCGGNGTIRYGGQDVTCPECGGSGVKVIYK